MGFRMSIHVINNNTDYGDDHKLYGYFSYNEVKQSFDYIHKFINEQDDILSDSLYSDPKECYDMLCGLPEVGEIKLSEKEFEKFSELYLEDVKKNKNLSCYNFVHKYMTEIVKIPGDKILEWY